MYGHVERESFVSFSFFSRKKIKKAEAAAIAILLYSQFSIFNRFASFRSYCLLACLMVQFVKSETRKVKLEDDDEFLSLPKRLRLDCSHKVSILLISVLFFSDSLLRDPSTMNFLLVVSFVA